MTTNKDLQQIRATRGAALDGLPLGMAVQAPQIAPEHGLIKRLKAARRLTNEVIDVFQIEPFQLYNGQWGYLYKVIGGGYRWKNAQSSAVPKYAWLREDRATWGKEDAAFLYHAPDLLPAIESAGGVVYYATDANLWALRAAGIRNAVGNFSEEMPDNFDGVLMRMGVTKVISFPDLDGKGKTSAERNKSKLNSNPIESTFYALPESLRPGGDIGDAWKAYNQAEPFESWLRSLPQMEFKTAVQVHKLPAQNYTGSDGLAEIKERVKDRFPPVKYNSRGWSNPVLCIFHDDKTASAQIGDAGLKCHTCAKIYTWKELAAKLEIAWTFTRAAPVAPVIREGIVGMSAETKAAWIDWKLPNIARALDVLIHQGRAGDIMNLAEFSACLLPYFSVKTARVTFEQLQGKQLPKHEEGSFCPVFSLLTSSQHTEGKKVGKNSPHRKTGGKTGRPQARVRIPTEAEQAPALGVQPATYYKTGMTDAQMSSRQLYRARVLVEKIYKRPGPYARVQLAKKKKGAAYDTSNPTIKTYCGLMDIEITRQPDKVTRLTAANIATLPKNHRELILQIVQKKVKSSLRLGNEFHSIREYTQEGARRLIEEDGGTVVNQLEYQASDYRRKGER